MITALDSSTVRSVKLSSGELPSQLFSKSGILSYKAFGKTYFILGSSDRAAWISRSREWGVK